MNQTSRTTERLRLEPIGPELAHQVWLLYRDPIVNAWDDGPFTPEQAEAFALGWRRRWEQESIGKWLALLHDGTLVGRGGLSRMAAEGAVTRQIQDLVGPCWGEDRLELGWALRSEFHGQGYASEIGREGLVYAKEVLGARAVTSFTERHNAASRRVMERIGMSLAGEIAAPGLVEGKAEQQQDAPFAVYVRHVCDARADVDPC